MNTTLRLFLKGLSVDLDSLFIRLSKVELVDEIVPDTVKNAPGDVEPTEEIEASDWSIFSPVSFQWRNGSFELDGKSFPMFGGGLKASNDWIDLMPGEGGPLPGLRSWNVEIVTDISPSQFNCIPGQKYDLGIGLTEGMHGIGKAWLTSFEEIQPELGIWQYWFDGDGEPNLRNWRQFNDQRRQRNEVS